MLCLLTLIGCGEQGTPAGAVVGRAGRWDYTPSVIQTGDVQQFWWCGSAPNPAKLSQDTDAILYESIDVRTGERHGPFIAFAETPGAWDSAYTCNPRVVKGAFGNPLGDGQSYSYALYYVGTANVAGTENSIGVAFSNDGRSWKKYPSPVIPTTNHNGYGVAQPVAYNSDGKQAISLFYEDDAPPHPADHHWVSTSVDGVHFTNVGLLTTNGLGLVTTHPTWADMVYSPTDGYWYALYNIDSRDKATTNGILEFGQWGFQVYRIPKDDLMVGATGWQEMKTIDTNLMGYESNFLPGILQDGFGNVYLDKSGAMQIFPAFSNEVVPWDADSVQATHTAQLTSWDIGRFVWSPTGSATAALNRYRNSSSLHIVTTGYIDTSIFTLEKTLGQMYSYPQAGATTALYACKKGKVDQFVSLAANCEGSFLIGLNGYMFATAPAGRATSAIYRCSTGRDHFVSQDPLCEGSQTEQMLGYIPTP